MHFLCLIFFKDKPFQKTQATKENNKGALHLLKLKDNDGFHKRVDPPQLFLIFSPPPSRPSRQKL